MKRRWISLAAWWMAVVMLLMACSPKDSGSTGGVAGAGDLTAIPVEETLFALNRLSQEEVVALTTGETFTDLMLASPFYQSESTQAYFQDQRFFEVYRQQVATLVQDTETFEQDVSLLQGHNDYLQGALLLVAQELAAVDPDIEMYYYPLLLEYRDMNTRLSLLKAQMKALQQPAENPYTQAWQDYLLVHRRMALAQETLLLMTRVTQDALLLEEEVSTRVASGMTESVEMLNLKSFLDTAHHYDFGFDLTLLRLADYQHALKALERSDAYVSLAIAEGVAASSAVIGQRLASADPTGKVTPEELNLAREANRLHQETATEWRQDLLTLGEIQPADALRQQLGQGQEEIREPAALGMTLPTLWLVAAADTRDLSAMSDAQVYYEKAVLEAEGAQLVKSRPEDLPEKPGFFQRMKQTVTNTTGRILERANTLSYNYFFESYAAEIGVDAKEIEAEKQRVREEEARRIRDGEAGAAVINQAIGWMEAQEQLVVDWIGSGVGENENLVWITKAAAKYGIGKFTDGSKGILRLMDPTATEAQLSKAVLDIAGTVFDFSKAMDIAVDLTSNFVDEDNQRFLAEALEKRAAPQSKAMAATLEQRREESYRHSEEAFRELFSYNNDRMTPIVTEVVDRMQDIIQEERVALAAMKEGSDQELARAEDLLPGEEQGVEEQGVEYQGEDTTGHSEDQATGAEQGREENQGAVQDLNQEGGLESGADDPINSNTIDLKKGTYSGHYVLVETDVGTVGEREASTVKLNITVTDHQVILAHQNNPDQETLTFTIEQTDMAGRIKGKGYASSDFVVRPDMGPTGQHLLLLEFHAGGTGEARGKITLHYVNQRIGYMEFIATKN